MRNGGWLGTATLALAALCCALAAALWLQGRSLRDRPAAFFAAMRVAAVDAQLAEAEPGYVLLAGDSHAETNPVTRFCDRPVVNAGVSGARASEFATFAERLHPVRAPAATVLTIGTNDLRLSLHPRDPDSLERFDGAAASLIGRLKAIGGVTIVTAVPPLGRTVEKLDAAAVPAYAARLRSLCDRLGCIFADPFAPLRDPDGTARAGTLRDGVHLVSYRDATARLEQETCRLLPPR